MTKERSIIQPKGYENGNSIIPEGTIVEIFEHSGCTGIKAISTKITGEFIDRYVMKCVTCNQSGMIVNNSQLK